MLATRTIPFIPILVAACAVAPRGATRNPDSLPSEMVPTSIVSGEGGSFTLAVPTPEREATLLGVSAGADLLERRESAALRSIAGRAALAGFGTFRDASCDLRITLSGTLIFAAGSAALLAPARAKLDELATALAEQGPDSTFVVGSHLDTGEMAWRRQELSQRRSEAVRRHLVSRGIAPSQLASQGFGTDQTMTLSMQGRANQRVEIVVQYRPRGVALSEGRSSTEMRKGRTL